MSTSPFKDRVTAIAYPLVISASLLPLTYGITRLAEALRRAVVACRSVPAWSFQLHDSTGTLHWIGPEWPKNGLGDPHAGFRPYAEAGSTALATIPLDSLQTCYWFSDAAACHQIMDREDRFKKDMASYEVLSFHGPNIIASEGATWKRYRHAVRAAFSEKNYSLVWDEAGRTLEEWFNGLQSADQKAIELDVVDALRKVTLNVLASAGFGQHFPWEALVADETPTELPFSTSITDSVRLLFWRALTPRWAMSLPVPQITRTKLAFSEVERHVMDLIREGSQAGGVKESSKDAIAPGSLLRGLLDANAVSEDELRLSDRELLSNIYVFLLAGHDTTAHTVSFVMAIFALYPDIHARVREEADNIWPNLAAEQNSTYKADFARLPYTLGVFYETLRHFPSVPVLSRVADHDTTLPARKRDPAHGETSDQPFSVPIGKGATVIADVHGLHMNTQYWGPTAPDFDPTRFLAPDWPKHAFMPFASGQRACIGRGFAAAESVRIIAGVAQMWDVRCTDSMMRMPWEERKQTLLRWRQDVTTTPVDVKLVFARRQR